MTEATVRANGIEIPFPQQDVHIKASPAVETPARRPRAPKKAGTQTAAQDLQPRGRRRKADPDA